MANREKQDRIIREIRERYGNVIDLATSPLVLIEIIRNYRNIFNEDDGTGGVSPGTSTVAVAGPDSPPTPPSPPSPPESDRLEIDEILKGILRLQRQIDTLDKKLDRLVQPGARN
ncbi:MAG: hypothetical protein J0I90_00670 [Nitrosospira sp.]|jgi:hypothetical protein|nr:hypothetical protein [Nitrosospira sp.]MBN9126090.1 hypothetical protein [Nitrosospira sp.]OJY11408.1 MAG: hypothetical protein BGO99_01895 [Nitrosospira sp. 56-18]